MALARLWVQELHKKGLVDLLKKDGFKNIQKAVGCRHRGFSV